MRIHAIQTGEVEIKTRHVEARRSARPARVLDVLTDRNWAPPLPILCWAIEHPEGLLMVDTGETSHVNDPGHQPWWDVFSRTSARFSVTPEDEVRAGMQALGLDPAAVRWVVMTHMHGDHAGGLRHFPGSEIVMSDHEARAALARTGPMNGYLNSHYPAWLEPRRLVFNGDPWESFDASIALTSDGVVRLIPTPGHTGGHLSVAVESGDDLVLIAGDAAYSARSLLSGVVDGVAGSAAAHRDSSRRLRELCRRRRVVFLPSHDPESSGRLQAREPTTITADDPAQR